MQKKRSCNRGFKSNTWWGIKISQAVSKQQRTLQHSSFLVCHQLKSTNVYKWSTQTKLYFHSRQTAVCWAIRHVETLMCSHTLKIHHVCLFAWGTHWSHQTGWVLEEGNNSFLFLSCGHVYNIIFMGHLQWNIASIWATPSPLDHLWPFFLQIIN